MEEFPANSDKSKRAAQEPKVVERIIEGEVIRRRPPLGRRFIQTFFGGEPSGVMHHVITDVLIPAARDMVADAVSQSVERILFGEVRTARTRSTTRPTWSSGGSSYTSYNRYSSGGPLSKREDPRPATRPVRNGYEFDDIILATRVEATEVIERMFDLVGKYGQATVSDLYSMVGVSGDYTDEKWGWTDMQGSTTQRVRDGFLIQLPRPEPLN